MDTHTLVLEGGPEFLDFPYLESFVDSLQGQGLPFPVRALIALRERMGQLLGWDGAPGARHPEPTSYYWRMSEEEQRSCWIEPGHRHGPARRLWNDRFSSVFEISNSTCQAFAVVWIEGRQASLSIFVLETQWWSKYYLWLIEPFRRYLVYPLSERWLQKKWCQSHRPENH
jgi:hypothetical protein